MRSAAILALALSACSSPQASRPPEPPPDDVQPPQPGDPPPATADRTLAVPADHPLYARVEGKQVAGECSADADCVVGGCSAEVCSTEQVQTTCEARDWPTKGKSCGCVSGMCQWYGEPGSAGGGGGDQILVEFQAITDRMCACGDKTCAETVNQEFEAWLKKNENSKGSKAQQDRAMSIAEQYTKCMVSAMATAPAQGEKCGPGDRCGEGLTCLKYYGVAGGAGPQLSSCEIPCGKGKPACPTGQTCRTIADGPGQVCRPR